MERLQVHIQKFTGWTPAKKDQEEEEEEEEEEEKDKDKDHSGAQAAKEEDLVEEEDKDGAGWITAALVAAEWRGEENVGADPDVADEVRRLVKEASQRSVCKRITPR